MWKCTSLCLALLVLAPTTRAAEQTTASRVFAADSPSVVVVKAVNASGQAVEEGSGVVIAAGVVVSNCHVVAIKGVDYAEVFYGGKRYRAVLRYGDLARDLCSFTVKGLSAPPVKIRDAASLKVGENVYAIGAPEGLSLTLSSGIVSSLRKLPHGIVIQTTAPISPGSSGGGLFDSKGRLIGITSYYMKKGQQLNFALPTEWIKALPQHGKTREQLAHNVNHSKTRYRAGVKAYAAGDYKTAIAVFKTLASQGDPRAQDKLAFAYFSGIGVPQDYRVAAYWYRRAAEQGSSDAQLILGFMFLKGKGVPQNYTQALYWYGKLAQKGHARAQTIIGEMYAQGKGAPKDYAKAVYWFRKAARQGDAGAQMDLGVGYDRGWGAPHNPKLAVYWYRKAAEQGNTDAQYNLGLIYAKGRGVPQDYEKAAKWLILAKATGSKDAADTLFDVETLMTISQVARSQQLASEWWATHHRR